MVGTIFSLINYSSTILMLKVGQKNDNVIIRLSDVLIWNINYSSPVLEWLTKLTGGVTETETETEPKTTAFLASYRT